MSRAFLLAIVLTLFSLTSVAAATSSTWPVAGHDAQETSYNANEHVLGAFNAGALHRVWAFSHTVTVIATDTRVYAITVLPGAHYKVVVLNALDGHLLFTYSPVMMRQTRYPGDYPTALAYADDTLIVGSTREVTALNPHTGRTRWSVPGGATWLTVNNGVVYTGKGCQNGCGTLASYAINLKTGRRLWQHIGNFGNPPVLLAGRIFQTWGEYAGETHVYDPRAGQLLATLSLSPVWLGDQSNTYAFVLNGPGPGNVSAKRSWIGRIASYGLPTWKTDLGLIAEGNPVLANHTLYVPSNRHHPGVIALNARNGKLLWGADIGPSAAMVGADGLLYALHEKTGVVDVLRMSNGTVVRRLYVPGYRYVGTAGLMVAGGTLYVVGENGVVAMRP